MSFNRYFCYITKLTSIWPVIISLTVNKTIGHKTNKKTKLAHISLF